jgi:hypothetical protein
VKEHAKASAIHTARIHTRVGSALRLINFYEIRRAVPFGFPEVATCYLWSSRLLRNLERATGIGTSDLRFYAFPFLKT